MDGDEHRHALALFIVTTHQMAGTLGGDPLTSTLFGCTICPKWMLNPCANMSVAPSLRFGPTSFLYTTACIWSGTSIMTTSARWVASGALSTSKLTFSARSALAVPLSSLTTTVTPLSRRFCAWACPWLPKPAMATVLLWSRDGSASLS
jgi:hypothetical protein